MRKSTPPKGELPGATVEYGLGYALRLRLFPNTALLAKQIAHDLRVDRTTFGAWCRGENDPSWCKIGEMARYFARLGDHDFLRDVYGPVFQPLASARSAALRDVTKALEQILLGNAIESVPQQRPWRVSGPSGHTKRPCSAALRAGGASAPALMAAKGRKAA